MVKGLEAFRRHFADYADSYILIGGTACEINLNTLNLDFRATRDLDVVLCAESLTPAFGAAFWRFIREGGYRLQEKSTGGKVFYRFRNPENPDYPAMIELFSQAPENLGIAADSVLTPIPMEDEVSSLSAILLNPDYYAFIRDHRTVSAGLSVLDLSALIVLKAKAWCDLTDRRNGGEHVDSKNIRKHKNDICRLLSAFTDLAPLQMPDPVRNDMTAFLARLQSEEFDFKAMNVPLTRDDVFNYLRTLFGIR